MVMNVQGEHKVFPCLQTFITRKLCGIQKEHMLKCTCVVKKLLELSYIKKKNCIPRSFLVINVCNQGKTLCSPCIFTSGIYSQGQELRAHFCYLITTLLARIQGQERQHPVSVSVAIPCIYMCLHVGKWTLMQESIMSIKNKLTFHCNVYVRVCMCYACT